MDDNKDEDKDKDNKEADDSFGTALEPDDGCERMMEEMRQEAEQAAAQEKMEKEEAKKKAKQKRKELKAALKKQPKQSEYEKLAANGMLLTNDKVNEVVSAILSGIAHIPFPICAVPEKPQLNPTSTLLFS